MGGKRRSSQLSLSSGWREWVVESLQRDIAPSRIVDELHAEGVPKALATQEVACIDQATRSLRNQLKRVELVLATRKELRNSLPSLERTLLCSREEFQRRYLSTGTPVLFENAG
jgi:hypothetical protein